METLTEEPREFREHLTETILIEALDIKSFPDYRVTKCGNIVSLKGREPIILRKGKAGHNRNYDIVVLSFNGKLTTKYVHRLVADAFIPNPEEKTQVNHRDGRPSNNEVSNLEWVTPKENMKHAHHLGLSLQGVACPWTKNSEKVIRQVCQMLQDKRPLKEIRETCGIDSKLLWKIHHRKQWVSVSNDYAF
jgi:hypothetical protein